MPPVIYDVAVTLDGYICGADEDISAFPNDPEVVEDYAARLATYATALMGRRTYAFGYRFGLEPGANPYPHMDSLVISSRLTLPAEAEVRVLRPGAGLRERLETVISASRGPVYLCGGGTLAGTLARFGMIDELRLKRAPVTYGTGTPLFSEAGPVAWRARDRKVYASGVVLETYCRP